MPQSDIFFTAADIRDLANLLFLQGVRLVPDLQYATEKYTTISDAQEFERYCREHGPGLLFALSPKWQRSGLVIRSTVKKHDGKKIYYVSQVDGGPRLDIYCPPVIDSGGEPAIQAGFIAYNPKFWNPSTESMETAPIALIDCYKGIRKHFLADGEIMKLKVRSYIVTKNAKENGCRLILPRPLDSEALRKLTRGGK